MVSVFLGLFPSVGAFSAWQMFMLCFLLGPMVLFRGGLEEYVLGSSFAWDSWSSSLVYLSLWLGALMVLSSPCLGTVGIWGVVFCCVFAFSSFNFLSFYFFFEVSLIPICCMILQGGSGPERLSAASYMMLYTLLGSLPLLVFILFQYSADGHVFFGFSSSYLGGLGFWSVFVVLAFLIKLPCFPFHIWLAKAHVEAPVVGSMALAGLLLKLGGLGIMRVISSYGSFCFKLEVFWFVLCLWGGVSTSLICLRQVDGKSLVAYSSVGHMSLVLAGVLSGSSFGWHGAVFLMVCHGLCSSGLFSIFGEFYSKLSTRSLLLSKGLLGFFPSGVLWWFALCVCCMSCPPSGGFLAEILVGSSLCGVSFIGVWLFCLSFYLCGGYSFILYSSVSHGPCPASLKPLPGSLMKCNLVGGLHVAPLFVLFLFPGLL